MKKSKLILIGLLVVVMLVAGCSKEAAVSYDGSLSFTGLDEDFSIACNDIYAMDAVAVTVNHISSDGEENTNEIEGVLLDALLAEKGLSKKDFTGIRLVAGDGYAMDVPQEIFLEKDIILAYKFDGEVIEDKKMPLRAAIDGVRSMYYVSNLIEVQFAKGGTEQGSTEKMILMETAFTNLPQDSYTYYESEDTAILASDLFSAHTNAPSDKVYMMANDGYDKTESYDVLKDGYIKITGKDAPLFTGKDLPVGMNVKHLMNLRTGNTSFVSVQSALEVMDKLTIADTEGIALDKLVDMAGLIGEYYVLTANDGYSIEVSRNAIAEATVYVMDDSMCAVKFDEKYPKNTGIKSLLSIELGDGTNSVTGENTSSNDTVEQAKEETVGWTITFEGLSDGSFDFSNDKAERKLEAVKLHTERTKNDETYPEDWKGYKLLDALSFLRVEEFDSVVIVAGDGYEVELKRDAIDDETILAVEKNGEILADPDNLVQLVQNTEFATTWIKGVAKVIIK